MLPSLTPHCCSSCRGQQPLLYRSSLARFRCFMVSLHISYASLSDTSAAVGPVTTPTSGFCCWIWRFSSLVWFWFKLRFIWIGIIVLSFSVFSVTSRDDIVWFAIFCKRNCDKIDLLLSEDDKFCINLLIFVSVVEVLLCCSDCCWLCWWLLELLLDSSVFQTYNNMIDNI